MNTLQIFQHFFSQEDAFLTFVYNQGGAGDLETPEA